MSASRLNMNLSEKREKSKVRKWERKEKGWKNILEIIKNPEMGFKIRKVMAEVIKRTREKTSHLNPSCGGAIKLN